MNKYLLTFLIFSTLSFKLSAQIDLLIDYKSFQVPDDKAYYEFYLSIDGRSLSYNYGEDSSRQAEVEMTYILSSADSIVAFKKFRLLSPKYSKTEANQDIIDIKRIPISNGDYVFEFIAEDVNSGVITSNKTSLAPLNYNRADIQFSEIQLCNSIKNAEENSPFAKNGLEIIPNIGNFFGYQHEKLGFYLELYNTDQVLGEGTAFLMESSIVPEGSDRVINNLKDFNRLSAAAAIPVVQQFDIQNLPSGNYYLNISLRNRENEEFLNERVQFQRSNPNLQNLSSIDAQNSFVSEMTNKEELAEFIRSTAPISSYAELQFAENQLEYSNLEFMQQYFLNFWRTRNPSDPESEWLKYKKEVEVADKEFGYGGVKGYQTERGRIYLLYGKPSSRIKMPYEPETYPYSIWQYYKLNGLTNRRFIFYSPTMEMLGYQLLHSNMPGEIQNPNWEAELENKSLNRGKTYEVNQGEEVNRRARDLFDNPR